MPDFGSFLREYRRYSPDFSCRIMVSPAYVGRDGRKVSRSEESVLHRDGGDLPAGRLDELGGFSRRVEPMRRVPLSNVVVFAYGGGTGGDDEG